MSSSQKSKKKPKSLTELLNWLWSTEKVWRLDAWNDVSGKKVKLEIDFSRFKVTVKKGMNYFPARELTKLVWQAGMIPCGNENEINKRIEEALDKPGNRTVALAMDTNLVINRFYPNYMRLYHNKLYEQKPHFLVLCAGTDHEIHYKMSYTLTQGPFVRAFLNQYDIDSNPYEILTGKAYLQEDQRLGPLLRVPSLDGRLGVKGMREIRRLQEKYPVILSKPAHLYYSEKIQTEGKFVDAIFDSLIRYEADYLSKNSNVKIIFLTADKHQHQSAQSEGMDSIYVKHPTSSQASSNIGSNCFKISYVERLIEELLVFSPYLKITAGKESVYLSSVWEAMGHEEARDGVMKCIIGKNQTKISCS